MDNTTTTILLRAKWWRNPIRWWRERRERRALIGRTIIIDGKEYTVSEWKGDTMTVDAPLPEND